MNFGSQVGELMHIPSFVMYFYASSFTFRLFVLDLFRERNYQQNVRCASPSSIYLLSRLEIPCLPLVAELHKLLNTTDLILLKANKSCSP